MSLNNFIPTVWSSRLLNTMKKAHVFANVVNTEYQGEITEYGDSVKINSIGSVDVGDYVKNGEISDPQILDDAQLILKIDQAKYFNFLVDDIDKAQQKPKIMEKAMEEAGYALADEADKHIAGFHAKAGTEVVEGSLDQNNIYEVIADVAEKLDEKNVPREGRFFVIPPFMHTTMVLAKILETKGSVGADTEHAEGYIGRMLGFDFYMSNNLKKVGDDTMAMAGTRKAISYAEQILDVEPYRPEKRFSDAVKGLHVYGAKVIYPDALARIKVQKA